MSRTREQLLDEETLDFVPRSGEFAVDAVAEAIAEIGFSFRDETDPSMFVVCSEEESRTIFQARRREDPSEGFPYVLLIQVSSGKVSVDPMPDSPLRDLARQFIDWLTSEYECNVINEFGTDLTPLLAAED